MEVEKYKKLQSKLQSKQYCRVVNKEKSNENTKPSNERR